MDQSTPKLERASLEAYAGIGIGIMLWALPITWWLKGIGILIVTGLLTDVAFRSPWTHQWSRRGKAIAAIIGICIIGSVGCRPILDQYREDHKPVKAAFRLLITSFAGCSFLPPYPANSELITIWVKIDNAGAPSVAKDWSLRISPPGRVPLKATFFGLGEVHGLICGHQSDPSDALEVKTEGRDIIGITRGRLGFAETGITPQELANENTILTLSVLDKDGNEYQTTQRIGDLGPRLLSPAAGPPPLTTLPNAPAKN